MLFISGRNRNRKKSRYRRVSISSSRCFSFQVEKSVSPAVSMHVSISSSRCFSFQVRGRGMLSSRVAPVSISSSRCFSFQVAEKENRHDADNHSFQSRHRDAFHFRLRLRLPTRFDSRLFQSRNRDAFHFRYRRPVWRAALLSVSIS